MVDKEMSPQIVRVTATSVSVGKTQGAKTAPAQSEASKTDSVVRCPEDKSNTRGFAAMSSSNQKVLIMRR